MPRPHDVDDSGPFDLVIRGGRVIDPESGLDGIRDVALRGGRIAAISEQPLACRRFVDAYHRVVTAGFIDLHSHAQTVAGLRLQSLDGVTTALELEVGASPVSYAYRSAETNGRPINVGFSTSWSATRAITLGGDHHRSDIPFEHFLSQLKSNRWSRPLAAAGTDEVLARLETDLDAGALGIGIALGYAPNTDAAEYLAVARLAAKKNMPTFTHSRHMSMLNAPATALAATSELIAAASSTGAHMHLCHLNSSTNKMADRAAALWARARDEGARISTEMYPYGSGCTGVGADFLSPSSLRRLGLSPSAVVHLGTGTRLTSESELRALRESDPDSLVLIDFLDENLEEDRQLLFRSLLDTDAAIASDSIPAIGGSGSAHADTRPRTAGHTHPRSAGSFSRVLGWMVRERGALSLPEALRRCSLLPAQILQEFVPAMRSKGRIQVGCDADIVVFDPLTVSDMATYSASTMPSRGFDHVLVDGVAVVENGQTVLTAMPGRTIYSGLRN